MLGFTISDTDTLPPSSSYTVSFVTNGGSAVTAQSVENGEFATVPTPAPTRTGYTFGGWYEDNGTFLNTFDFGNTPITADKALYAKWTAKTYTVTFDAEGGGVTPETQTKLFNSTYGKGSDGTTNEALPTPTKTGYTFGGWYDGDNGTGTAVADATTVDMASNHTLYAKWNVISYTVTFDSNEGSAISPQTVEHGELATVPTPAPTKTGNMFGGWYEDDGTFSNAFDFGNTPTTGNKTLYAKWTANAYSVTFDAEGGDVTPATQTKRFASTYGKGSDGTTDEALPTPMRTGYTFAGWYTDDNGTGTAVTDASILSTASNHTLHAKWTANPYTVTFDPENGIVMPATQTKLFGSTYGKGSDGATTEALPTPTRDGYTFGGWYTGDNGSGSQVTDVTTVATALDHTLYAKWNIVSYTVSFDSNEGSAVAPQTVEHGELATVPATAPTKTGYTFGGWYEDDVTFSNAFNFESSPITGDKTLYAKWTPNAYTVTFDAEEGNVTPATQTKRFDSTYGKGADGITNEALPTPTRDGYTFAGWYTGDNGTGTAVTDVSTVAAASNHTLHAKWTANPYTVTFDAEGGDVMPATQTKLFGSTYGKGSDGSTNEALPTPTKTGYTFGGWFTGDNGTGSQVINSTTVSTASNHTLYAKWLPLSFTVTFDTYGGTPIMAQTVEYNQHTTEPTPDPTKAGYSFDGWFADAGRTLAFDFAAVPITVNTTVYANWTANAYLVTFDGEDGNATPSTQTKRFDSTYGKGADGIADELLPTPTRNGYTFGGWYAGDNGTGDEVTDATTVETAANHTLHAKWTANSYVITFDAEGGSVGATSQTKLFGAHYGKGADGLTDEALPTPTKTGFTFGGWYAGDNGTGAAATNATTVSTASNHTLYAKWNAAPPGAPTVTAAEPGDRSVTIEWTGISGATGYKIFIGASSGAYEAEQAAVGEAIRSYTADGLTNGTTYYFVVKAINPGGDSEASNEASATPRTVPGSPTQVTATAGNGQATVSFAAPSSNGGSAITSYEVTASPGNIVATGSGSSITVTGLTNGTAYTFTVKAINAAGKSAASTASNAVTPSAPVVETAPPQQTTTPPPQTAVEVLVNGRVENAGTATTTEVNGRTETTIAVDESKLEQRLANESEGAVITIPVNAASDVIIGELNGRMVKGMEQKQAVVEIRTEKATYTLPAQQINIDAVSGQFGADVALQDIKVRIEIAEPAQDTVQLVENASANGGFSIVVPPLEFTVRGTYDGQTVEVTRFNAYVERAFAIPDGVDPNKITTGVVVDPDGTVRHVPTKIVRIDGKYYATINSLTNSTYTVVWHPIEFEDVASHWAKDAANDMGSRMVVEGTSEGAFDPDRSITRAEFAAILVRGLGLKPERGDTTFADVDVADWYAEPVATAQAYGLISGFEDGTFRPTDRITREQGMTMIAKAMRLAGLTADAAAEERLRSFADAEAVSAWARQSVADSVEAGIVTGRDGARLDPQANMTRAEVAVIVRRLLQAADLI